MDDNDRDEVRDAVKKAGSLETFLDEMAQFEPEALKKLRKEVAEGKDHPTPNMLRDYAKDSLSREIDKEVADHIALCGTCAKKVLRLQYLEEEFLFVNSNPVHQIQIDNTGYQRGWCLRPKDWLQSYFRNVAHQKFCIH